MLKMVGLSKDRVQALLGAVQKPDDVKGGFSQRKASRLHCAYDMVSKGSPVSTACQSWGVKMSELLDYVKANDLPSMPAIISRASCRSRLGYEHACKYGMKQAVEVHKVSREAIFAYARRYKLPTPGRARYA